VNSIAIWSDNNQQFQFHLDLNLWITKDKKNNYIEFGIKLLDLNVDKLFLYLPFKFNEIEDKTEELQKTEFLNTMFNKSLSANNLNHSSFTEIKDVNKILFHFCKLSDQDFELEDISNGGTILNININKSNEKVKQIYYRFRINNLDNIFEESNTNWFFTNGIKENISFLEISINSVRKLPSYIVDKINVLKINSMNIFIMTESFIDLVFKSKNIEKSRVLETIWKDYVNGRDTNKILAYHWKKKESFNDYNLFVKTSYVDKSKRLIFGMFVIMLVVGAVGGMAGNFATENIKNFIKEDNNATISTTKK
jgi:hypothetical protein